MTVAELIEKLAAQDPFAEVRANIFNLPGLGEVYGGLLDTVEVADGVVVIEVTAP